MIKTFRNPVYPHSCPDPFVLKHLDSYWCYYTGLQPDGRGFGILHSPDLVHWQRLGSALDRQPINGACYWAPEVVYRDGVFFMYYSVGDEEHMQIRVAASSQPGGPFIDSGRRLTTEKFAIDPHVFIDDGDRWYFFYATDFLDYQRIGTGTVVDRMLDPLTLVGKPHPVTRARFDWQVFDPQRASKGGVRWHTIEGSFVLKRGGRYYQMFSGGNWQNKSYGVSYAVTERIDSEQEWDQHCDGQKVLPVLRTVPEAGVIGPGHNSVVRSPDNQEMFCVYHRWQPETEERVMAIDRLVWEGEELKILGPTTTDQPLPAQPELTGFTRFKVRSGLSTMEGEEWWLSSTDVQAQASLARRLEDFVLECWLCFPLVNASSSAGIALIGQSGESYRLALEPGLNRIDLAAPGGDFTADTPPEFNPGSFHLLRWDGSRDSYRMSVDGNRFGWEIPNPAPVRAIELFSQGTAAFAAFALTEQGSASVFPYDFTAPAVSPSCRYR